jgi:hypothetical protein
MRNKYIYLKNGTQYGKNLLADFLGIYRRYITMWITKRQVGRIDFQ